MSLCDSCSPRSCLVLNLRETAQCFLKRTTIRCSSSDANMEFESFSVLSAAPFRLQPALTPSSKTTPTPPVMLPAVGLTAGRDSMRVVARIELDAYVAGVLAGEASILTESASACGDGDRRAHLVSPLARTPSHGRIRFLLPDSLPSFPPAPSNPERSVTWP